MNTSHRSQRIPETYRIHKPLAQASRLTRLGKSIQIIGLTGFLKPTGFTRYPPSVLEAAFTAGKRRLFNMPKLFRELQGHSFLESLLTLSWAVY